MKPASQPTIDSILSAKHNIKDITHKTPIFTSKTLSNAIRHPNINILIKAEPFQKTGSFKFRGAVNSIRCWLDFDPGVRVRGVVTHSSGNHGQALAHAARLHHVPCTVVMPSSAPQAKKDACVGYGAAVVECEPTLKSREETVNGIVARFGCVEVPPYNHAFTISGQGTLMLEFLEQCGELRMDLDTVLVPLGGGGLLSGCCLSGHYINPRLRIIAVEPELANDGYLSLKSGSFVPANETIATIADGLKTSMGSLTYPIIKQHVSKVICVSEIEIKEAMKFVWQHLKIVTEPSGCVGIAALLFHSDEIVVGNETRNVGVVLTGGNLDLMKLFG